MIDWLGIFGHMPELLYPHRDPNSPWQKQRRKSTGNGRRHRPLRKSDKGRAYLARQRAQRRHERALRGLA